jgi:hypothetical protein
MDYYQLNSSIRKIGILCILLILLGNFSCGKKERTEPKSKTNSPPVISSINILPEKPTKASELNSFVQSHDPDGDPVTFQYQWMRNDEEITGGNNSSLKSGSLQKGDLIKLKVVPSDGKSEGKTFLSSAVRITNSSPIIQEVQIEPKVAYVTDHLKVSVKSSDPDGDFIYYTYQWKKNGIAMPEVSGDVLERDRFKKGDSIMVTAIPDDREALGSPKKSETLTILNSPPIIVSSPPTSTEGTKYLYQVKANDPDNDTVYFTLKAGLKGMEIDKNTGLIQWEIRKEDKGNHSFEIEVSDDEGTKSIQRYTLNIDFK